MKRRILILLGLAAFLWLFWITGMPAIVKELIWMEYQNLLYSEYLAFTADVSVSHQMGNLENGAISGEKKDSQVHSVRLRTIDIAKDLVEDTGELLQSQEPENTMEEVFEVPEPISMFLPADKIQNISALDYNDYNKLVKDFYTIDSTTYAGAELLNVESYSKYDVSVEKDASVPQILIYHTHSAEGYADSDPEDSMTGVVGVGEHLAQILRRDYGYNVMHCTENYDKPDFTRAYSKALDGISAILNENPGIRVAIDLHRDDLPESYDNTVTIQGLPCARFMFFNGLSRTRSTGELSYLENQNLMGNLAFSFALQRKSREYYPGLTRKIYLKGYRYNMHLLPDSLLLELGCQHNTYEEACNACYPFAHMLDMVLSGK